MYAPPAPGYPPGPPPGGDGGGGGGGGAGGGGGGKLSWPGFEKFNTVQDILDHNKLLIAEINGNHEARTPEGLARNVILIRELNANVAKVVELYKELSAAFAQYGSEEPPPAPPGR